MSEMPYTIVPREEPDRTGQKWPDNLLITRHGRSKRNHDREKPRRREHTPTSPMVSATKTPHWCRSVVCSAWLSV